MLTKLHKILLDTMFIYLAVRILRIYQTYKFSRKMMQNYVMKLSILMRTVFFLRKKVFPFLDTVSTNKF